MKRKILGLFIVIMGLVFMGCANHATDTPDQSITLLAIPGVVAPVTGSVPATVIDTIQYTGTITWAPADNPFAVTTVYTANIVLTAKAGWTLIGVTANSFTVAGAIPANAVNTGTVTAVFPETGSEEYSQIVGSEGGTVSYQGVSVTIPAGALSTATAITMTAYENSTEINGAFGVSPFLNGVQLGPDGLVFLLPISITLPLDNPLPPGEQYDVFTYDEVGDCWIPLDDPAVCGVDGDTITYTVNHFSIYAGSGLKGGSLSNFSDQLKATGDAAAAFANFRNDFINGRHVFDMRFKEGSVCYRFSGIEFDVMSSYNGIEGQFIDNLIGERSANMDTLKDFHSYMFSDAHGNEIQIVSAVTVQIYFEESPCEKPQVPSIFLTGPEPMGTVFTTNPWRIAPWSMPANLPSYNGFSLSSSPHQSANVVIINSIGIMLGGVGIYSNFWTSSNVYPLSISPVAIQMMEGKSGTVEFANSYQAPGVACSGGTTAVWIIYSP